ncbi:MAG: hypothetical protein CL623_11720 [Arcobacter sp.]|nr:hypothetical protein [Arcobacter sp.]|tara:strand:+ start:16036 stop:17874 length:1839 start_codon:yes stop_codon:yes gene_type:complete
MSFKYRFILSFVVLEAFFIILIVSINFFTINTSSKNLTNEKIQTTITLLSQLLKTPISVYDIAALDDLIVIRNEKYINSIIILDAQDRILSDEYTFKYISDEEILKLKTNKSFKNNEGTYEIVYKKIFDEDTLIGSFYTIFDTSSATKLVEENENRTILIILLQIIISTFLSYFIGSRLTKKLEDLSAAAIKIGRNEKIEVPFYNNSDEIGLLSKSMIKMQSDLKNRTREILNSNNLLEQQKVELEEANKSKDDFLANMSHELKTPLNSINVVSSVMQRNKENNLNEKQIKNLSIINKCGNELLYLINDVLDLSKLEANEIVLSKEEINVNKFITNVYETILPQVKEKGLELVLDIDPRITTIISDEKKIYQIIKNFLSNALKFTKDGKISIIVKDLEKNISISVSDEGIGIPKEKLAHIFDRFKQVDASTSRNYGGTGLGLAISQELASLLKGGITIQSTENVGTSFELSLPKDIKHTNTNKEVKKEPVKKEIEENIPAKTVSVKKENILIFNSDPIFFFNITMKLGKKYKVFQSNNAEEFLIIQKENDISKTVIDFSSILDDVLKKIKIEEKENIIAIFDDKSKDKYSTYKVNILKEIGRDNIINELKNI